MVYVIILLYHFIPDGINGFGSSFYIEFQTMGFKSLLDRGYEVVNIGIPVFLRIIKLPCDTRVKINRLHGRIFDHLFFRMMIYRPHEHQTVYNHNDDHTDILCKCEHQISEIFRCHSTMLMIKRADLG